MDCRLNGVKVKRVLGGKAEMLSCMQSLKKMCLFLNNEEKNIPLE